MIKRLKLSATILSQRFMELPYRDSILQCACDLHPVDLLLYALGKGFSNLIARLRDRADEWLQAFPMSSTVFPAGHDLCSAHNADDFKYWRF